MNLSSCDIGNPAYKRSEPKIIFSSYSFTEVLEGFTTKISYEYYELDRSLQIVKLEVETNYESEYLTEDVTNLIELKEGKRVFLETEMNVI